MSLKHHLPARSFALALGVEVATVAGRSDVVSISGGAGPARESRSWLAAKEGEMPRLAICQRTGVLARMAGLLTALVALVVLAPSSAHASGCTDSWGGSASGSWFDGKNWSRGGPPGPEDEACITESGTYTVTMTQTDPTTFVGVKSLTIGGSSGTQTLAIGSSCPSDNDVEATSGTSVGLHGAITLTDGESCSREARLLGPITNAGTITAEAGNGGTRSYRGLGGPFTNTGTLAINTAKAFFFPAAVQNEGAINLAEGAQLTTSGDSVTNAAGGTISGVGTGAFIIGSGSTFTEGAGTTSGSQPVIIEGGTLKYTSSGASVIKVRRSGTLSGNIASGQSLVLESACEKDAVATAATGFINAGTITTVGPACVGQAALVVSTGTLTNTGTITTTSHGLSRLEGNLTNAGTLAINGATEYKAGALLNKGAIKIATGVRLNAPTEATISNEANGAISSVGTGFSLIGQGSTFTQGAGTTSGAQPVIVEGGALKYTGAGASTIALRGSSTLSGTINASQTLSLESTCFGEATATAASFLNSGTINLTNGDECAGNVTLNLAGGTLENKGVINSQNPVGGARTIEGNLVNDKLVSLSAGESLAVTGSYTQAKTATLKSAIKSTSVFGSLSVAGPAALDGTLALSVARFSASPGQFVTTLVSSALNGTFTKETGGKLKGKPAGLYFKPTYSTTEVTLVVTQATVALSKAEGPAGSTVTISGTGYSPGDTVKLTFTDQGKAKTVLPSVTANASGEFSTEVNVPAGAVKGAGKFTATSKLTGVAVTATFTVT